LPSSSLKSIRAAGACTRLLPGIEVLITITEKNRNPWTQDVENRLARVECNFETIHTLDVPSSIGPECESLVAKDSSRMKLNFFLNAKNYRFFLKPWFSAFKKNFNVISHHASCHPPHLHCLFNIMSKRTLDQTQTSFAAIAEEKRVVGKSPQKKQRQETPSSSSSSSSSTTAAAAAAVAGSTSNNDNSTTDIAAATNLSNVLITFLKPKFPHLANVRTASVLEYEVERILAETIFGHVALARHTTTKEQVAIKISSLTRIVHNVETSRTPESPLQVWLLFFLLCIFNVRSLS
jgi:hypothetical protein